MANKGIGISRRRLSSTGLNEGQDWGKGMVRALSYFLAVASVVVVAGATPAHAQKTTESPGTAEPDRIRGEITKIDDTSMDVKTADGKEVHLALPNGVSIFSLSKASFTDVDFGTYVGAVSVRLDAYSPIVRDSLSWLHKAFELRIMDEELRGLALGHTTWDLTPDSVMSHGWVDDLETRVISIKYGPTEEEETDVDIPRDVPVQRMSLGDRSLMKPGAHIFAGAQKDASNGYAAVFVLVGTGDVVPAL